MKKDKNKAAKETQKALKTLADGAKADPEQKMSARTAAAWFLSQPATDKSGNPIIVNGRQLTNGDATVISLIQSKDTSAKMAGLTIAGMLEVAPDTDEEKKRKKAAQRKHKNAVERIKRNTIKNLKAGDMYDSSLLPMIRSLADLGATIEEIEDQIAGESIETVTTSREGAMRRYTRSAVSQLANLQSRRAKSERDLIMTALQIKRNNDLAMDATDDEFDKTSAIIRKYLENDM